MEVPKAAVEEEKQIHTNTRQKLEMLSDGEPRVVLCEQEVMHVAQCVRLRGEFIAQLFAFLPRQSAPTALLQTPAIGAVQELWPHL